MAWAAEQADKCPSCGTQPWEWDEDHRAYEAVSYQCLGCLKTATERERLRKQQNTNGMHTGLVKRRKG